MLDTKTFRRLVEQLVRERGTTIWEVSLKLGHSRNWLYERMRGKQVGITTIRQVAKVLKVPAAFFLTSGNSER